jgi:hypothetical protein
MLDVTPERVAAVYDCLRTFEPWCSLGLPPAEEIEIHVRSRRDCYGEYQFTGKTHPHKILVSSRLIGSFVSLADTVGHEMLHLAQELHGTSNSAQHNEEFRRLARIACRKMIWDERAFVG